jgi:hypothetical protein
VRHQHVLVVVLFSSALFFGGISTRIGNPRTRRVSLHLNEMPRGVSLPPLGEASPPESLEAGDDRSRRCTDNGGVAQTRRETVSEQQLDEMGPIDYVVLEWKGEQPDAGEVQPLLLDLVDRGIIRILDIAFLAKDEDGSVSGIELGELKQVAAAFAAFEGASSGLLGYEDLQEAAAALDPGTTAAVLVWENRWAAPVAAALRRSGGQLVASGRLPIQAILAALDQLESSNR